MTNRRNPHAVDVINATWEQPLPSWVDSADERAVELYYSRQCVRNLERNMQNIRREEEEKEYMFDVLRRARW